MEGLRKSSENYTGIKYERLWSVFVDMTLSFSMSKKKRSQLSLQVSLGKKVILLNMEKWHPSLGGDHAEKGEVVVRHKI